MENGSVVKTEITDEEPYPPEELVNELDQIWSHEADIAFKSEIAENVQQSLKLDYETCFDIKSIQDIGISSDHSLKTENLDIEDQKNDRTGVADIAFGLEIEKQLENNFKLDYENSDIRRLNNTNYDGSFQAIKTEELDIKADQEDERSTKNSTSCNQARKSKILTKTRQYCPYCNRSFNRRESFNIHLWRRHSIKNPDETLGKYNLQARPTYSCMFCNKTVVKKGSLADHLLCQHGEKFDKSLKTLFSLTINYCKLCNFKTICITKLNQHMEHAHSLVMADTDTKLSFRCKDCDYETFRKCYLQTHIQRKHSNDSHTYTCRFCNKTFLHKASLADHLLSQHGEKFDKSLKTLFSRTIKHCQVCDFRVITKAVLIRHMKKYAHGLVKAGRDTLIFKCNNCDYETREKCNLPIHIQTKHSIGRVTYSCRFCNKTFFKKRSLADHLLRQHGEKFDKSLKSLFSLTIKHCQVCDFRTIIITKLNRHMETHDNIVVKADTDTIVFKCNNCDYESFRKSYLQAHIQRKHSNDRPTYLCRFCNKTVFNKASLANHLLCKHGKKFDKSLKTILSLTIEHCKLCDFRVINKTILSYHIQKQHSKDRPTYSCRVCNKTFCNKVSLADHLLRQHDKKFDKYLKTLCSMSIKHCQLCDFRTIFITKLNQHMKKHGDIPV